MKLNVLLGTLVLGFALTTQSYGFELLDRMLGGGGASQKCGACQKDGACQKNGGPCQKNGPCQKGKGCGNGSCQKNGKGACQKNGGPCQKNGKGCGNGSCQKNGGACQKNGKGPHQKGHGKLGGGLLSSLFPCNSCGKGKGKGHKDGGAVYSDGGDDDAVEEAPMPPAPIIDPSALRSQARRTIVPASYVR